MRLLAMLMLLGQIFSPVLAEDGRSYEDVFDGLKLTEKKKAKVRRFDEWAFQDRQGLFIGLGPDKAFPRVMRIWYLRFEAGDQFLGDNESMLSSTTFFSIMRRGIRLEEANVLVLGLDDTTESLTPDTARLLGKFWGGLLPSDFLSDLDHNGIGDCAFYRKVSANQVIEKTLIAVARRWKDEAAPEARRAGVSCMNKGLYYHLGFSNVEERDDGEFAIPAPSGQGGFIMNWDTETPPNPPFIRSGSLTGRPRGVVLRAIAEYEARKPD